MPTPHSRSRLVLLLLTLVVSACSQNPQVSRAIASTFNDHHTGRGKSSNLHGIAETVECEAIVANTPRKCTVTFDSRSELRDVTVLLKDDRGTFPAKYSFDQSDSSVVVVRTEFDGTSMTRQEAASAMDATNVIAYSAAMVALGEEAGKGHRRFANLETY